MQTYFAHATPRNIGYLLIIAVALWGAYKLIEFYCDRAPIEDEPKRYPVDPNNLDQVLAHMDASEKTWTGTPLPPQYWKMLDASAKMGMRMPHPNDNLTPPDDYQDVDSGVLDFDRMPKAMGVSAKDRADTLRGTKL